MLQCIWHIDAFRQTLEKIHAELKEITKSNAETSVLAEIINLFEEAVDQHINLTEGASHPLIDSKQVRRELYKCYYGDSFSLNEKADAS